MSCGCKKEVVTAPVVMPSLTNNCICSLPTLIILILIVLQFSKKDKCCEDDHEGFGFGKDMVGNGILFIIALFFLSCAGCGRGYQAY